MKVAIFLSGLPRSYKEGYYELKKWFLDRYNCDVYLHTWKDTTTVFKSGHKFAESKEYQFTEEDYQGLLDLYQPKEYYFQKPITFDNQGIESELGIKLNVSLANFHSIRSSFQLIEESGIEYDYVIRTRYDLKFTDYISPECLFLNDISKLDPNKLNFFAYEPNTRPLEIDDLFAVSSIPIMKTYSELAYWVIRYLFLDKEYKSWIDSQLGKDNSIYLVNETLLRYHMLKNGIQLNPIPSLGNNWSPFIMR